MYDIMQSTAAARRDQTAALSKAPTSNARNLGGEKETIRTATLIAPYKGAVHALAKVAWYMARSADGAGVVYCTVWIFSKSAEGPREVLEASGHGRAGGYGYHKGSAAMSAALDSAGVTLANPISGRGESMEREALHAIAAAMGYRKAAIL